MKGHRQRTDGVGYETEYAYNLSGAMVEQRYPSGRVVKNVLDASGDLSMVQSARCMDVAAGTDADCAAQAGLWNYARHFTYNPAGAVTSMQLGNGRWESTAFNARLQPTQIALGATRNATNLLKLDYSYGTTSNNGNVLSQTITVPSVTIGGTTHNGFTAVQNYAYDSLNRLDDAAEYIDGSPTPSWRQDFTFDRYGNRSFVEGNTTFEGFDKLCANNTELCAELRKVLNPSANAADNRLSSSDGYVFDLAGNTVRDPQSRRFTYDGENKQVMVETLDLNGIPVSTVGEYVYDGDGKRVKKHVPSTGEVTVFVYDAGGKLIGEYSTVAAPQSPKVSYTTADHLGSPRILTDENGTTISRRDFMPFGEEIARSAYGSDTVRQKFTGYERDGETDLDFAQARMYATALGRFSGSDPLLSSARSINPKTWNRFTYTLNNPLKFVDPTGLYECLGSKSECNKFARGLSSARSALEKIKKRYGDTSDEYINASRAIAAYGKPGDNNGVYIRFGPTTTGAPAEASGVLGAGAKKEITVMFDLKHRRNQDPGVFASGIAHEGSHVFDRARLADAAVAALAADKDYSKGLLANVFADPSLNITSNTTETTAYGVQSVVAEFLLKNEAPPESGGGTFIMGNREYQQQDLSIGNTGVKFWNPAWSRVDVETVRSERSKAIAEGLAKDPQYSKQANERIGGN